MPDGTQAAVRPIVTQAVARPNVIQVVVMALVSCDDYICVGTYNQDIPWASLYRLYSVGYDNCPELAPF